MKTYHATFEHHEAAFSSGRLKRLIAEAFDNRFKLGDVDADNEFVLGLFSVVGQLVPWRVEGNEVVFSDGSVLDDWSSVGVEVQGIRVSPLGLMGDEYTYKVTLTVPPSARYKRAATKRRSRG